MLNLVLALALMQQPKEITKPSVIEISTIGDQKLKEVVQKLKDLQVQVEAGQKDAQNILLQVVIETLRSHPGFNEQDYDVTLKDGKYIFQLKETNGQIAPNVSPSGPGNSGQKSDGPPPKSRP